MCAVCCCNAITPIASFWVLIIPWTNSKSLRRAKEIFKNYSPPKHTHRRQQKKVRGADCQRCVSELFSPLSKRADSLFFSRCLFQLHHSNSHISGAVSFWNILYKINSFAYYNLKNSIYYDILIDQKDFFQEKSPFILFFRTGEKNRMSFPPITKTPCSQTFSSWRTTFHQRFPGRCF